MSHPFQEYMEGLKARERGERDRAARLLANSLGAEEPTRVMEDNLDCLFDSSALQPVMFRMLKAEERKRGHGR